MRGGGPISQVIRMRVARESRDLKHWLPRHLDWLNESV